MRAKALKLLERLLPTHSPSGDEGEMEAACLDELDGLCAKVWQDDARNVIGLIEGSGDASALRLMAHKDEIGCMVARIDDDGKMRLEALGGAAAWAYGEGPMDVLGDEVVTGILGIGSKHVSPLSADIHATKTDTPMNWDKVRLDCKLTREELEAKGIRIGTRVCLARSRKAPIRMGDYIAGYAMDDKAAVAVLVLAAQMLKTARKKPERDMYLIMTSAEEVGIQGAAYAARTLPGDDVIAVDVAPIAPEYPTKPGPDPVMLYMDGAFIYDKGMSDDLCDMSEKLGHSPQRMAVRGYGSDATYVSKYGLAGRVAGVCMPTENTHGCEIIHIDSVVRCAELLAAYAAGGPVKPAPRKKKGAKKRG